MQLYCLFCAQPLRQERDSFFDCPGCHAAYQAQLDPSGCVIQMQVKECGTPDCCRRQKSRAPEKTWGPT